MILRAEWLVALCQQLVQIGLTGCCLTATAQIAARHSSRYIKRFSPRAARMGAEVRSSLPGLTPQVGFTRLAAFNIAKLGQARVSVQSISLRKNFLAKKMDARVKPAHDRW